MKLFKELEKRFIDLCKDYYDKNNFLYMSTRSDKKQTDVKLEHNLLSLEFCYVKKATYMAKSTLYCRIYLNKNSVVHYHLADILGSLKIDDYRSFCFAYIESPERMEACFNYLTGIIEEYMPQFEKLVLDDTEVRAHLFKSFKDMYKMSDVDLTFDMIETEGINQKYFLYVQKDRDDMLVHHFTNMEAYHNVLLSDFEKAEKRYNKLPKKAYLFPYETGLLKFISKPENADFKAMPEKCFSQKNGQRGATPTPLELLKYTLIAFAGGCVFFFLLFFILNSIFSRNTLLYFAPDNYYAVLPAAFCGIFGGIAFRNEITLLFYKKDGKEKVKANNISTSKGERIFYKITFAVFFIASLYMSVMMLTSNARFYDDKITFSHGEFFPSYVTYDYEDISGIYYIDARYNEYGDRIERASYVIGFNDGETLDLDGYTTVEECEAMLIPHLSVLENSEVKKIDSDKELFELGYKEY